MVSIHDIAREAGVSATTVSRVLNKGSASPRTRERVLETIRRRGYIPDARASSLKRQRNRSIGVIIPDIANPAYPPAVKSIHDTARARGYHLILGSTHGSLEEERQILRMMARERVQGLLLGVAEGDDDSAVNEFLSSMIAGGTAVVVSGRNRNGLPVDQIAIDNRAGARKAVGYLARIGRGRIAFLAGPRGLMATEGRLDGYRAGLADAGLASDDRLLSFGGWTRESGRKQTEALLAAGRPIDAVFCGNDLLAIGALETLRASGRRVPDDIAIVGFDDIELASLVQPRLTTVVQPQERIGALACTFLLDRIEGAETGEPREILIEPELIVRESA